MSAAAELPELGFTCVPDAPIEDDGAPPAYQAVLRALVRECGSRFETAATIETIRKRANVCRRTVTFALAWLAAHGRIEIIPDPDVRARRRIRLLWRRARRRADEPRPADASTDVRAPVAPIRAPVAPMSATLALIRASVAPPPPIRESRSSVEGERDRAEAPRPRLDSEVRRRRPEPDPEPPSTPEPAPTPTPAAGWRAFTAAPDRRPVAPRPPRRRRDPCFELTEADLERMAAEGDKAAIAELEARRKAAPVPELPPPTTPAPELIRQLATHPLRDSIVPQAASAIVATLGDSPGSWTFWDRACREVTAGLRDPESLATPLERTVKAVEKGRAENQPIESPGRYYFGAVKTWDREHGPADGAQKPAPGSSAKIPPGPVAEFRSTDRQP